MQAFKLSSFLLLQCIIAIGLIDAAPLDREASIKKNFQEKFNKRSISDLNPCEELTEEEQVLHDYTEVALRHFTYYNEENKKVCNKKYNCNDVNTQYCTEGVTTFFPPAIYNSGESRILKENYSLVKKLLKTKLLFCSIDLIIIIFISSGANYPLGCEFEINVDIRENSLVTGFEFSIFADIDENLGYQHFYAPYIVYNDLENDIAVIISHKQRVAFDCTGWQTFNFNMSTRPWSDLQNPGTHSIKLLFLVFEITGPHQVTPLNCSAIRKTFYVGEDVAEPATTAPTTAEPTTVEGTTELPTTDSVPTTSSTEKLTTSKPTDSDDEINTSESKEEAEPTQAATEEQKEESTGESPVKRSEDSQDYHRHFHPIATMFLAGDTEQYYYCG